MNTVRHYALRRTVNSAPHQIVLSQPVAGESFSSMKPIQKEEVIAFSNVQTSIQTHKKHETVRNHDIAKGTK